MDKFTYAHSNYFNESEYKFSKSNFDIRTKRAQLDKKLAKTQFTSTSSSRWRSRNESIDKEEASIRKSVMNSSNSLPFHKNKQFINKALYMIKRNYFTKVGKAEENE